MKSLHHRIYDFLETIPQDGTMDQSRPLKLLQEIARGRSFYSFDLSNATDRLPTDLQAQLLNQIIGPSFGDIWKLVLCDRNWYLKDEPYRYAVGQPMGAYSSFGMLALTHHYIVQLASYNVGNRG